MSATLYVVGLRDRTSADHQKKAGVLRACKEAEVDLPKELETYFKAEGRGIKYISADDAVAIDLRETDAAKPWEERTQGSGFEVDLAKLPPGVKTIRFYIC